MNAIWSTISGEVGVSSSCLFVIGGDHFASTIDLLERPDTMLPKAHISFVNMFIRLYELLHLQMIMFAFRPEHPRCSFLRYVTSSKASHVNSRDGIPMVQRLFQSAFGNYHKNLKCCPLMPTVLKCSLYRKEPPSILFGVEYVLQQAKRVERPALLGSAALVLGLAKVPWNISVKA
jgi:hypothetical protein